MLLRTEEKDEHFKASSDYYIKGEEPRETRVCKMVDDVNDLIKITRDSEIINGDEEMLYHVILRKQQFERNLFQTSA